MMASLLVRAGLERHKFTAPSTTKRLESLCNDAQHESTMTNSAPTMCLDDYQESLSQ